MIITLTDNAIKEIKRTMLIQSLEDNYLRVGVTGGGCSGFQYSLNFDTDFDSNDDHKFEQEEISIIVDKKSALYLDGIVLDFYDDGLSTRGFTFNNPNATKSCGCGSSFSA